MIYGNISNCTVVGHGTRSEYQTRLGYEIISEKNPDNEYHRVILEVEDLHTNKKEKCFVYFYNKDKDTLFDSKAIYIPHGDWKEHMVSGSSY